MVTSVGLPLLIVNGKFQSLKSMTVKDLETFIPFLVKCSVNRAGAQLVNGVPEWWSSVVQFKFPLKKPKGLSEIGYLKCLCNIVCHCYWYHDAQYLLPFCATIAKKPETVLFKSNNDSTTSIFYAHKPIQIMKFNNLNKMYDVKPKKKVKDYRTLLPQPKKPTIITDVYLCENCDAEFTSHSDMLKHESECCIVIDNNEKTEAVDNDSSDEIQVVKHIKIVKDQVIQQNAFLNYFGLGNKNSQSFSSSGRGKKNSKVHSKQWVNAEMCLHKNRHIEFSSNCGRNMLKHFNNYNVNNKIEKSIANYELFCGNNYIPLKGMTDYKVTFKSGRRKSWTHQYSFNKRQQFSRYFTLKYGKKKKK